MAVETDGRHYTYRILSLIIDIGGGMYRTLFTTEAENTMGTVQKFLKHYRSSIEDFKRGSSSRKQKVISDKQFSVMFPNNSAASSADGFDVTLLAFLLMNICPSFCSDKTWHKKLDTLQSNDFSDVAELVRIREYRNKVMHEVSNTKTAFTENTFNDLWNDITDVLYRLHGKYNVPDLNNLIDEIRDNPLDNKREEELQNEIKHLKTELQGLIDMDEMMTSILQGINEIKDKLDDMPFRQANMSDLSLWRKKNENEKKRFVETKAFKAAKEKLLKNNLVILKGNAGEGKTTVAKMLLFDMKKSKRVWNVSSYNDWIGIDLKDHDVIIIDDIFGACVIDLDKCNSWRNTFSKISSKVEEKKIKVIITCRSHILNEAIDKAFHHVLVERKNVQTLELDEKEMEQILRKHLKATGKENDVDINECLKQANLKQFERILPIGFPECVRLFCSNTNLFEKGPSFFTQPYKYVRESICSFFANDVDITYSAFFLLWALEQIKVRDLEKPLNSIPHITNLLDKLQLQSYNLNQIRKCLKHHRNDFIHFDKDIGVYTFKHRIIADVVGIVSFEINSTAVFECCDFEFAMKYITIEGQALENVCAVEQYQFDQLTLRLTEFMNLENGRIDGAPLDHNAFTNSEFCSTFINESMANNNILSASVVVEDGKTPKDLFLENGLNVDITEFRMASYSIWKQEGRSALANEWFRAFSGADQYTANTMDCTEDIFGQNKRASRKIVLDTHDRNHESQLTADFDAYENAEQVPDEDSIKTELYLAVMFAIKFGNINLIKALFMYGAKVADDMITLAWLQISKPNTRVTNDILQHLCTECEHGNYEEPGTSLTRLNEQLKSLIKSGSEFEVVTLLKCNIRYGYLVENDKYTALHFACKLGKTEIVLSILRQFARLDTADKKGYFPIHYATRNGHIETVKALLNNDIQQADKTLDADTKWLNGATLLHIAVDKEHTELIKYLTDKRKFSVDNLERTPLMFALKHKKFKSIHCLLECENIDKKTPDKDGYHPLHISIMQSKAFEEDEYKGQNVDSIEPHLHSSVNFFSSNRTTSLHRHCSVCWLEIVDKLLQNDNVQLDDVNASGVTPLQLASANRQDSIVILLQEEICFRYYTRHWQKE